MVDSNAYMQVIINNVHKGNAERVLEAFSTLTLIMNSWLCFLLYSRSPKKKTEETVEKFWDFSLCCTSAMHSSERELVVVVVVVGVDDSILTFHSNTL